MPTLLRRKGSDEPVQSELLSITKLQNKVESKPPPKRLISKSIENLAKERPEVKTLDTIEAVKKEKPITANSLHSIKLKTLNIGRDLSNFPAGDSRMPLSRHEQAQSLLRTSQVLHKYKYGVTSESKTKMLLNHLMGRPETPHETYSTETMKPGVRCRTAESTKRDHKNLAIRAMSPEDTRNKQHLLRFNEGLIENNEPIGSIRQKSPLYTTASFRFKKTYRYADEVPNEQTISGLAARKFSGGNCGAGEDFGFDDSRKEHFFQEASATVTAPNSSPSSPNKLIQAGDGPQFNIEIDSIESDSMGGDHDESSMGSPHDPNGVNKEASVIMIPSHNAAREQLAVNPSNMLIPRLGSPVNSEDTEDTLVSGLKDVLDTHSESIGEPTSPGRIEATITRTIKQATPVSGRRGTNGRIEPALGMEGKICGRVVGKCGARKNTTQEMLQSSGMMRIQGDQIHTRDTVNMLVSMLDDKKSENIRSRPDSPAATPDFQGVSLQNMGVGSEDITSARSPPADLAAHTTGKIKSMLIKCAKCFKKKAALWCPQCKCAYCGICWIGVAHHALPSMAVPGDEFDRTDYKTQSETPKMMNKWSSNAVSKYRGVTDRSKLPADRPKDPSDRLQMVVHDYPLNPVFLDATGRVYHFEEISQVRPNTAKSVATTNISLRNSRAASATTSHQLISIDPDLVDATSARPKSAGWAGGDVEGGIKNVPTEGMPFSPFEAAMTQKRLDLLTTQYIDGIHKTKEIVEGADHHVIRVDTHNDKSVGGNSDTSGFTMSSPSRLAKKIAITPTAPPPVLNMKHHNVTIPSGSRSSSPTQQEFTLPTPTGSVDMSMVGSLSSRPRTSPSHPSTRGSAIHNGRSNTGNAYREIEHVRDPYLAPVANPFRQPTPQFVEHESVKPSSPGKTAREFVLINRTAVFTNPAIPFDAVQSRDLNTLTYDTAV